MQGAVKSQDTAIQPRRIATLEAEVAAALERRINNLRNCPCNNCIDLLWGLRLSQLWPVYRAYSENTVASLITKLTGFRVAIPPQNAPSRKRCKACMDEFYVVVREHFRKARSIFPGLCLDCVKYRNEDQDEPYACRSKHKGFQGLCGSVL